MPDVPENFCDSFKPRCKKLVPAQDPGHFLPRTVRRQMVSALLVHHGHHAVHHGLPSTPFNLPRLSLPHLIRWLLPLLRVHHPGHLWRGMGYIHVPAICRQWSTSGDLGVGDLNLGANYLHQVYDVPGSQIAFGNPLGRPTSLAHNSHWTPLSIRIQKADKWSCAKPTELKVVGRSTSPLRHNTQTKAPICHTQPPAK